MNPRSSPADSSSCLLYTSRGRGDSDGAWRELRQEMSKDYPNKAKALELYKEASKTRREQAKARFEEVLKDPARFMQDGERRRGRAEGRHDFCGSHRDLSLIHI